MQTRRSPYAGAILVAALGVAPCLAGPRAGQPGTPVRLETRDDPYLPPLPQAGGGIAGGGPVVLGDYTSVQVNVGSLGENITGDAGNEPSIAVDPTAPLRMAIGWRQFDNVFSNFRQAGYSWSDDGGRSWHARDIIEPGVFRSDPVLRSGSDGTFYYLSLHTDPAWGTDLFRSTDGGATWPAQTFAYGGDKSWLAIDMTGGVGDGNLYQAWNVAGNEYYPAQFNRSTGGSLWQGPLQYDPGNDVAFPVFGQVAVGPDGAVYVAGTANDGVNDTFWVVKSDSAKNPFAVVTFNRITDIDLGGNLVLGAGPNPGGLLGQVNIAVDSSGGPYDGNVYVLSSINPQGPDPLDVHVIVSTDGGATFGDPVRVNDDPPDGDAWQWFGEMSVAPNGRIDVIFNDTRNSLQDNISELFYTYSTDGGQTWAPNVQISPSFDSYLGFPAQNKIGDYYDLRADEVGADLAWSATFNGEQDVYYTRIGDYDCNGNGIGDAGDIASRPGSDCNANGIPDECEIAAAPALDGNGNGTLDACEVGCPWDCGTIDGTVSTADFLGLLSQWGQVGSSCDFDGGGVSTADFTALLEHWGPCP